MRRVSALWGGGGAVKAPLPPKAAAGPDRPSPPTDPPPADKSWLVDTKMIEDMAVMVPSSPEDVDDATKQLFLSRTFTAEEYRDWDFVMYNLGVALDIFPDTTTFVELKWVFWTDNALGRKLTNLVQALSRPEFRCLEVRHEPDYQFRKYIPKI